MLHLKLRTLFVIVASIAFFFAWRCSEPEREIVAALKDAGGEVYLRYQAPKMERPVFISQMILDDRVNFEQWQIKCGQTASPRTALEFMLGSKSERYVSAVKLPISAVTPDLMERIGGLIDLRMIYIEMGRTCVAIDSPEAKRFEQVRLKFGDKVFPTLHPAFSFPETTTVAR